jgi:hypothetical protein
MIPHYRGKGGLVIVYFLVSIILIGSISYFLNKNRIQFNDYLCLSIALLLTAMLTYLSKDVYIRDKEGNKIKIDFKSSLFFIEIKYWVYILLISSLIFFLKYLLN